MMKMAGERISWLQVTVLFALSRITVTLVYFPAMGDPSLKQDVWLGHLLGALWSIPFAWVFNLLWQRFPRQTFVQVLQTVLGKVVGKVVTLGYLFFLLLALSTDLRHTGEFYVSASLPRTPIIVIIGVFALMIAWAAKAGVEVIARAGQVVFPIVILSIMIVFVLLLKEINFNVFFPVYIQSGFEPHFKQLFSVLGRSVEFVWLGMLVPFVDQPRHLFRAVVYALLWLAALFVVIAVAITGVLGPVQQFLYFPFFMAVRQIGVADFLERLDAIILAVWFLGMFLRGGLILLALAIGTAQWLGLKHYRPLVFPLIGLAMTVSISMVESFSELRSYLKPETITPYMLLFVCIIPLLVLAIAALRGIRGSEGRTATSATP